MFWRAVVTLLALCASAWQSVPSKPTFSLSRPPQQRREAAPPSAARWTALSSTASDVAEEVAAEEPPKEEPAEEEEDPRAALKEQIADLEAKLKEKRFKLKDVKVATEKAGKKGYMLLAAQIDQFKRNNVGSSSATAELQMAEVMRALLPVLEGFERLAEELSPTEEKELKIHNDFQEIYAGMKRKITALGLAEFDAAEGDTFDDNLHTADSYVDCPPDWRPDGDFPKILSSVAKGYKLNDVVIRKPACVVVKESPDAEAEGEEESASEDGAAAAAAAEEDQGASSEEAK